MRNELDDFMHFYYGRLARKAALELKLTACQERIKGKKQLLASSQFMRLRGVVASIGGAETHQQGLTAKHTEDTALESIDTKARHEEALRGMREREHDYIDDILCIQEETADLCTALSYLQEDDVRLLELHYRDKRSMRAIGIKMDIESSTVSDRLDRLAIDLTLLIKDIKEGYFRSPKVAQQKPDNIPRKHHVNTNIQEDLSLSYV